MEFSTKLKELRLQKGISQAKLATDIHISRSAVAKWENGLGLPNDASLKLLADYFGVSVEKLLSDKNNETTLVSKNRIIDKQKKVIFALGFSVIFSIMIFLCFYIEKLRESMLMLCLGIILTVLGIFNMKGNISTIHWYNRRKVTKENQKSYCLIMGLGTLIIGMCLICAGIIQSFIDAETSAYLILYGIIIGFALMLYAQIKYNKGLF